MNTDLYGDHVMDSVAYMAFQQGGFLSKKVEGRTLTCEWCFPYCANHADVVSPLSPSTCVSKKF